MLLLRVIDQGGAVTQHIAATFPFHIGRAPDADLRIELPGVWESHAVISLEDSGKFLVCAQGSALLLVNDETVTERELATGDTFSLGSARILASLAPAAQRSLVTSELGVWCLLFLMVLLEVAVILLVS